MTDENQIRIFHLKDVKQLYSRKKKTIYRFAIAGALLATLMVFAKGPLYKVEASFKESKDRDSNEDLFKNLFSAPGSSQSSQFSAYLRSNIVLRPLVEKMGLQVTIPQGSIPYKLVKRFWETLKAERGKPLTDIDGFAFSEVKYEGEVPAYLGIRFLDHSHFEIMEGKKGRITGVLGMPVQLEEISFTVTKTPQKLKLNYTYPLRVAPWVEPVKWIRSHVKITSEKSCPMIYHIAFPVRDRTKGAKIVNELMVQFQQFLQEEYQQFAQSQLNYLSTRQNELFQQLNSALVEHAAYLSTSLGEKGFMNLEEELKVYVAPYLKMTEKTIAIDLELQRLKEGFPLQDESPFAQSMKTLFSNIQELERERDLLEISLSHSNGDSSMEICHRELEEIRLKRDKVEGFLEKLKDPNESPLVGISFAPNSMIASWAKRIQQNEGSEVQKKDMVEYLANSARLLSIQEKIVQSRFLHKGSIPPEFEGIDLKTARQLFIEYNRRLDQCEASIRHIETLREQMLDPSFELSSLSPVITDSVGQSLIAQGAQISFQLKDEKNRTSKEGERWREDLDLKRNLLKGHLDQLLQMEKTNSILVQEKIGSLQQVSLDCINRQISVIHEQINDTIDQRQADLIQEKKLLAEKMEETRSYLKELPQKWHMEQLLQLKSKMSNQMMQAIAGLVESKTIGHQMHHIASKPIDFAIPPYLPMPPKLLLYLFFGAFLGGFSTFFVSLLRNIQVGFPIDGEKLKILKYPYCGEISSLCDGPSMDLITGEDLEALREIALFIDAPPQAKIVGLLSNKGPDYSFALAEVMKRMGVSVCLMQCDFHRNYRVEDSPGLKQYLEGEQEELPIIKRGGFDYVPRGGYSPFGLELIQSDRFLSQLSNLKSKYDLILLIFRSELQMAESKGALKICDKVVVTVQEEQIDLLTPFASWAYHEGQQRLTFIASGAL